MTIAHIVGMPFEEWLGPIAVGGSGVAFTLRLLVQRHFRR